MLKRGLLIFLGVALLVVIAVVVTGHSYVFTATARTYLTGNMTANVDDHRQFDTAIIKTRQPQHLPKHPQYNQRNLPAQFIDYLQQNNSIAFLIIKDGQVLYEDYYRGYHQRSKTNSFSMAKTVSTLLVGIAIEEGHIQRFDQPISDFIAEFKDDPLARNATLAHLALMNSGYEWSEHYYLPFSPVVELYHGADVENFLVNRHFSAQPGAVWEYSSASTQLLAIALRRALRNANAADSLSEYLSAKLWQPMQMNDDALWHTDAQAMELAYCCLNTNARNFAKLGLLMLNDGNWHGQQLVPAQFVQKMRRADAQPYYGYSTWLNNKVQPRYYSLRGHLGQYVAVLPELNAVVVRLGKTHDGDDTPYDKKLDVYVSNAVDYIKAMSQ